MLFSALKKFLKFKRASFGYTLIEILVVMSIIAILTAISIASYTNVQQRGRDGKRLADIKTIQQALERYYADNGHYPWYYPDTACDDTRPDLSHCMQPGEFGYRQAFSDQTVDTHYKDWPRLESTLVPKYLSALPNDPWANMTPKFGTLPSDTDTPYHWYNWHVYGYTTNGKSYYLCANMENPNLGNNSGHSDSNIDNLCPNETARGVGKGHDWADYVVRFPENMTQF
jgi:prepilin-type N-terminal cleavage/methylation domain-containing protein